MIWYSLLNLIFSGKAAQERIRPMMKLFYHVILLCVFCLSCNRVTMSETDTAVDDSANPQEQPSDSGADTMTGDFPGTASSIETDSGDVTGTESESDLNTGNTDSLSLECDGENVDCYAECWDCALADATCQPALTACLSEIGCNAYYKCLDEECCGGANGCLTGDAWEDCAATCADDVDVTDQALDLYADVVQCVACDVCEISCKQKKSLDFAMCADTPTNVPHCYAEDAPPGDIACFSWAGEGGPCTDVHDACRNDESCQELDMCVMDSWAEPNAEENWEEIQEPCFATAGQDATDKYWAWMQCIYCDACAVSCARDAVYRKCDTYEGK
jgi:hypothetical protein